jgi:hypothetical protein
MPQVDESILLSTKKLLGLDENYEIFDTDVVIHINSALAILNQLGVGPENGFRITGKKETWSDFLGDDETLLNTVKDYVYLKTRLVFDPPVGSMIDLMKSQIAELEWRINISVDPNNKESETNRGDEG